MQCSCTPSQLPITPLHLPLPCSAAELAAQQQQLMAAASAAVLESSSSSNVASSSSLGSSLEGSSIDGSVDGGSGGVALNNAVAVDGPLLEPQQGSSSGWRDASRATRSR